MQGNDPRVGPKLRPQPLAGAVLGVLAGCFYVVVVFGLQLVGGRGIEKHGLTLGGAAWVGAVAMMPLFLGMAIAMDGPPAGWSAATRVSIFMGAVLVGGGIGVTQRRFIMGRVGGAVEP